MLINISKAAKELGVSIPTLRNWDESNYLPSIKTKGGHRRYALEKINEFKSNDKKKFENFYTSWNARVIAKINEVERTRANIEYPDAKAIGGFTKEQIQLLLNNQKYTENFSYEVFEHVASNLISPYLFATQIMTRPNFIVDYLRVRHVSEKMCLIMELDDIVASNFNEDVKWKNPNMKEHYDKIIENIDENNVRNISNNCRFNMNCSRKKIKETIKFVCQSINEATSTSEWKWLLVPPELMGEFKGKIQAVNNHLKKIGDNVFVSRLVKDNEILIGTKSECKEIESESGTLKILGGFNGYLFAPFILTTNVVKDREGGLPDRVYSQIGIKLLREGSNFFGKIIVE